MRVALRFVLCCISAFALIPAVPFGQSQTPTPKPPETVYLLKPAHIFDGESAQLRDGWVVLVRGEKIEAVGPAN
ncbi:MAG TPA: hypothetical protein VIU65_09870, partial [Pyrinomonadaceae bacterium]